MDKRIIGKLVLVGQNAMKLQENLIVKALDKALTIIITCILLFIIILIPFDVYSFLKDPTVYIRVYNLDPTQKYWEFQYLNGSILLFFGALAILTIMFLSFKYRGKKIVTVRQIIVFGLIGMILYGYYQWYLTGFDH